MTKQQQQQQHRIPKDLLKVNNTKSNNMMLKWEKGAIKGKGGIIRWSTEDVEGSETILHETVIVNICHYTFVKTHKIYSNKSEQ